MSPACTVSLDRPIGSQDFRRRVQSLSGQNPFSCYQCGTCSAACPYAYEMDVLPHQIMREIQLGERGAAGREAIWVCASCLDCQARCPQGIDLPGVMEALRQITLRQAIDRLVEERMSPDRLRTLPQIALVASYRKKSG